MDERRRHPRIEIEEPALISAGGSVMTCVVRNISTEGASIDVENAAFVPQRFRLVRESGALVHECKIVWIQNRRIGVAFVPPPLTEINKVLESQA